MNMSPLNKVWAVSLSIKAVMRVMIIRAAHAITTARAAILLNFS